MRWRIFYVKMKLGYLSRTAVRVMESPPETRDELNSGLTAAILHEDEETKVPEEVKLIFYAEAELSVRYFF